MGGASINFAYALAVGTQINIEFCVTYKGKKENIQAQTRVIFITLLADNHGAKLGLRFQKISPTHSKLLANILHLMGMS